MYFFGVNNYQMVGCAIDFSYNTELLIESGIRIIYFNLDYGIVKPMLCNTKTNEQNTNYINNNIQYVNLLHIRFTRATY